MSYFFPEDDDDDDDVQHGKIFAIRVRIVLKLLYWTRRDVVGSKFGFDMT